MFIRRFIISIAFFFIILAPSVIFAQSSGFAPFGGGGLIPCGTDVRQVDGTTKFSGMCTFDDLIRGVNGLIQFMFYLAVPLATVAFAYAGVLYLTASGDTGKISQAHKIFRLVVIGLIIMFSAWIIVHTIAGALLKEPDKYYNIKTQ